MAVNRLHAMFEARFQTFEDANQRAASPARVAALRAELARRGLDGFVVPRADRHQGEYAPADEERLAWITGFTGSAGVAVVLSAIAVIFVDGRYVLQVRDQVDTSLFAVEHLVDNPPDKWLGANLPAGARLGYDPWLHTADDAERLAKACGAADAALVPVGENPLDAVWTDRPPPPLGPVTVRPEKLAGETSAEKLKRVQAEIAKLKADALIVSDPHNVAWTFNIRGSDVAHTPLPLSFAHVPREGAHRSSSTPASSRTRHATISKRSATCARRPRSRTRSPRSAPPRPMSGSIPRPARTRSRG